MPEDTYYPEPDDQQENLVEEGGDTETPEYETGLLPKEIFNSDIKPGDTMTFKVVRVLDDEVEVARQGKTETEMPAEADQEIDRMAMGE